MLVLIMENESLGRWLARSGSTSQNPLGSPSLFYVLNLSTAAARKQLLQLQPTESLPRKENNCGRLFFFPLKVTASILADSYLFSATSHLPEHYQKCSNYCQLSLGSHRRQGQAGRPPDSWMLNSDESFGQEDFSNCGTVSAVYPLQSLHWHTNEASAHLIIGCCNKIQMGT